MSAETGDARHVCSNCSQNDDSSRGMCSASKHSTSFVQASFTLIDKLEYHAWFRRNADECAVNCYTRAVLPALTSTWQYNLQVARGFIQGIEQSRYIPRSPDSGADFLVTSCLTVCEPRPYPLLVDMLLSPLYVLLHWIAKRQVEDATRNVLLKQVSCSGSKTHTWRVAATTLMAILAVLAAYVLVRKT